MGTCVVNGATRRTCPVLSPLPREFIAFYELAALKCLDKIGLNSIIEYMKFCPKCQEEKLETEFYKCKSRKDGLYGYCKSCFNASNDKRRDLLKEKAILYKGGECIRCHLKYPETPAFIFDFHHRDPTTKEQWESIRKWGWERIRIEIDKCDLVCSNCHRFIEYGAANRS